MKRCKLFFITTIFLILICSLPALAVDYIANGSDWNTLGDWLVDGDLPEVPTVLPGFGDGVFSTSSSMSVAAGETGNAWYVSMGNGAGGATETLDVYGTLNVNNAATDNSWLVLGNNTAGSGNPSVLTIHDGAQLDVYQMDTRGLGGGIQTVIQDGGNVNIGWAWLYGYNYYDTKVDYVLNGGTFDTGVGLYQGSAYANGTTNTYMTIDINGGTLVMNETNWNNNLTGGVILANGAIVTTANMNDLLDISGVGSGTITATTKTAPVPDTAWNESPADSTTDVAVLGTILSWSAGQNTISHDVYFSTDQNAVANDQRLAGDINHDGSADIIDLSLLADQWLADGSADIVDNGIVDLEDFAALSSTWGIDTAFKGNQTGATYDPGPLAYDTTYYWRIDEVDAAENVYTGQVFEFSTEQETMDLASDTAWTLSIDGGQPRPIKVTAGGWNSDQQDPQIPSASVQDHVIYERPITIPQAAAGKVIKVEFGGCNYGAEVFLDDYKVTENHLPMVPFEADLTGLVTPGESYLLRVKAYTRFHYGEPTSVTAGFDFNTGMQTTFSMFDGHTKYPYGLTGYVRLAIYPSVYISDIFVRTSVNSNTLSYDVWITNGANTDHTVSLQSLLTSWNGRPYDYPTLPDRTITVGAGQTQKVTIDNIAWDLGTDSYWWPNIPFSEDYIATLHWLELSLTEQGNILDQKSQRFGFVEYLEGPYYYTVNGVRFTSLSDSNSYGQVGEYDCWSETACFLPPDGTYLGCPETWKRYQRIGFNSMRLSTSVPTRYMLDTADEAGYMLIPEGGSWGNNTCTFDKENFSAQLQGMIRVCRNHPSVARYSMANESYYGTNNEWRWLIDAALEVDPTRPYVYEVYAGLGNNMISGMVAGHAYPMVHYDSIVQSSDMIRGMGECHWDTFGMEPFGSSARALRLKDWAHLAPWSWINYWPNFLEGMNHERHPWKYNNHADRTDGVDGWNSSIVTYVQRSLNPYLILDHERLSVALQQSSPKMEVNDPAYLPGESIERQLEIFNGGLFGNQLQLHWTARWDTPNGPVVADNTIGPFTVEPGFHATQTITLTAPSLEAGQNNRKLYLLLETIQDENVVFQDDTLRFTIGNDGTWSTFDDRDSAVTYTGSWETWDGNPCYLSTEHYTNQAYTTATFTFTGTKAIFYGLKRNDLGFAEVYVDGQFVQTLDMYQEQGQYTKLYETNELTVGQHNIKIRVTGQKNAASSNTWVIIDAFQSYY